MEALKGKIRHIAESTSLVKQGPLRRAKGKVCLRMEKNFDPQGNLLEERFRSHKHINRITYQYNTDGLCTERREFSFDHVLFFRYKFKYDRWGHQIEALCFNPDGTLSHSQSSKYNQRGEEVEKRIRRGESIQHVKYVYDCHGNICEEYTTLNGRFEAQRRYNYDSHGNKTMDQFRNSEMEETNSHWSYEYNEQGKIVGQQLMSEDGLRVLSDYHFEYDGQGRRICTTYKDTEGLFSTRRLFYNEQGKLTLERWRSKSQYDSERLCGERVFVYDEQNRLLQETVRTGTLTCQQQQMEETDEGVRIVTQYTGKADKLNYSITHHYGSGETPASTHSEHYDDQGILVQESTSIYDDQGKLLEERMTEMINQEAVRTCDRYEYDEVGNWTIKTTSVDGQTEEIVTRKIEYWE